MSEVYQVSPTGEHYLCYTGELEQCQEFVSWQQRYVMPGWKLVIGKGLAN